MAKEFLSQRGVPYVEKDVSRDRRAASELQQLGQRGVPVIMVAGHMVVGFDRAQLERLLARETTEAGIERPRLGASIADAAQHAPPGSPPGAYVGRVRPGSPAARAGMQPGDIIVAMAGQPVSSAEALEQLLSRLGAQHPMLVRILRNGRLYDLPLDMQSTGNKEKPHV
jgi:S1-C subfamily serine protease